MFWKQIDDNIQLDEVPESDVSDVPKPTDDSGPNEIPPPAPVPSPAPFVPTPLLIHQESSTPLPFVPTSLPAVEQR